MTLHQGEIIGSSLFAIDSDIVFRSKQHNPDGWGTSQPHNAYKGASAAARHILHAEDRLTSGDITSNILMHESWKYSPKRESLRDGHEMIAPDTLARAFVATYAPLNVFEGHCKNNWAVTPVVSIVFTFPLGLIYIAIFLPDCYRALH